MRGLVFTSQKPVAPSAPNRVDVACFVGFVDVREGDMPVTLKKWLLENGWLAESDTSPTAYSRASAKQLLDVPIPVENWESFDGLFEWNRRAAQTENQFAFTYLGAAVRSFFAQGGRKCYVVRVGSPPAIGTPLAQRQLLLNKLIPGFPGVVSSVNSDRTTWSGIGHLFGLPDVSFLCLPDLPDLVAADPLELPTEAPQIETPSEQFVECSEPVAVMSDRAVSRIPAPACDSTAYALWRDTVHQIGVFLSQYRREVQLIASVPIPQSTHEANANLLAHMHRQDWLKYDLDTSQSIASAFVQLCYPWIVSAAGSRYLPQGLETPEGALAGMLARNALTRGTFRSATKLQQDDIIDIKPLLDQQQTYALFDKADTNASPRAALIDRVTLFGFTADGIQLLSDVTTANHFSYRVAGINRTMSFIVRAARRIGEDFIFDSSGEGLWSLVRERLESTLNGLWLLGALRGNSADDAYQVRCGRDTMTQNDIDSGRLIAYVTFSPAASIETMNIVLSLQQSGKLSLTTLGIMNKEAVA